MDGWSEAIEVDPAFTREPVLRMPISQSIFQMVTGMDATQCSTLVTSIARYRLERETLHWAEDSKLEQRWKYHFDGSENPKSNGSTTTATA